MFGPLLASLVWSATPIALTQETPPPLSLKFGVYSTDKPLDVYKDFSPVLEAVQQGMEASLEREVEIDLRIYKTYDEAIDAIVSGEVDFSRFGPASYILASMKLKAKKEDLRLLAMEEKKGSKRFNGHVVVRKDSDIQSLEGLKGRTFAFGDENSTIGRYLVQSAMVDAGLHMTDLARHQYLGRHDKVFQAVALGSFEAGALKESTFKKMNKLGQLRVLHNFENVTKPWIASSKLDLSSARALSEALCSISDPAVLDGFGVSAFVTAKKPEYDFVQKGMRNAERFEKPKKVKAPKKKPSEAPEAPNSSEESKSAEDSKKR